MDNMYDIRHLRKLTIGQLAGEFNSSYIKELMRRGYTLRTIAHFYKMPLVDFIKAKNELVSEADARKAMEYAETNGKLKPEAEKEVYAPTPLQEFIINHIVKCKGLKENELADYVPQRLAKTEEQIGEAVHQLIGHGVLVCANYNVPGEELSGRFLLPQGSDVTIVKAGVAADGGQGADS